MQHEKEGWEGEGNFGWLRVHNKTIVSLVVGFVIVGCGGRIGFMLGRNAGKETRSSYSNENKEIIIKGFGSHLSG